MTFDCNIVLDAVVELIDAGAIISGAEKLAKQLSDLGGIRAWIGNVWESTYPTQMTFCASTIAKSICLDLSIVITTCTSV